MAVLNLALPLSLLVAPCPWLNVMFCCIKGQTSFSKLGLTVLKCHQYMGVGFKLATEILVELFCYKLSPQLLK